MTTIKACTCKDEFQDKTYGKHMRVLNYHPVERDINVKCKCTVCGTRQELRKDQLQLY